MFKRRGGGMAPIKLDLSDLAAVLPPGGLTLVSSCSAQSQVLAGAVMTAGDALGAMTFSGVFLPGVNRLTWLANPGCRVLTFFMTPELKSLGDRVDFLPLCYQDILACYRDRKPDAALFMCSPPDEHGNCSFGVEVAFLPDLWRDIPIRIAHINPLMPRTLGDPGIPFSELTAYIQVEQPLLISGEGGPDPVANTIARHTAPYIADGATLQTGVGKVPDAVMRALTSHKNLRIHTGLMGDALFDLIEAGATEAGVPAVVGVALGSSALYARLTDKRLQFRPVSVTHDLQALADARNLTTINSAIEVDLLGQVYSELTPKGLMSGPGGATDFARGARASGGVRIIALPASAAGGSISRIVAPGAGTGPVSLSRMDVDVIITEHGAADLRGKGYQARAEALIAIAPPNHRPMLSGAWTAYAARL
jgi:acyl-CoA hydrolase